MRFQALEMNGKWLHYLALSVCANALIASVVNIDRRPEKLPEIPMLKINLMAWATPTPAPVIQQVRKDAPASHFPKIVIDRQAINKITRVKTVKKRSVVTKQASIPDKHQQKAVSVTNSMVPTSSQERGKQASTVIHQANYRRQIPPVYPRQAMELGQEGAVTLHAQVMSTGLLGELKVAQTSGYNRLDMAALAAVKKWQFEPTNVNGHRISSWVRVPVHFVIQQ